MAYFKENQLKSYNTYQFNESADRVLKKSASLTKHSVFLSHSHKDLDMANGLKNHLAQLGLGLYIDLEDSDLSKSTDRNTAVRIKNKIRELNYFFLLATNNSVKSRWVPWELGIADGYKDFDKIIVIPVEDDNGRFEGNEYLQVYKRLVIADKGETAVFNPNETKGIIVESFLK